MAYSEKVLDHYENPRNVGTFDPKKDNIGTGMVGAPACGDVMRLQIEVEEGIKPKKYRVMEGKKTDTTNEVMKFVSTRNRTKKKNLKKVI